MRVSLLALVASLGFAAPAAAVTSSPTDLTGVAVNLTGDFFPVPEPGAGLLVLTALAGQALLHPLARGARWRRRGGPTP